MSSEISDNNPTMSTNIAIAATDGTQPPTEKLKTKRFELKTERYAKIMAFYKENARFPSNRSEIEEERSLGQFLTNQKSARTHGKTGDWENECLANLDALHKTSVSVRRTHLPFLTKILEYCLTHQRTPTQASEDSIEKSLGRKLKSISKDRERFTEDEEAIFARIMDYRSPHLKSRLEKLMEVLDFCKVNDRTPKQHVLVEEEKRKADFLSSTKSYLVNNTLSVAEKAVWDEIETYRRPSKAERSVLLLKFVTQNNRAPKVNSDDEEERKIATFLTKLKVNYKAGTLEEPIAKILKEVFDICNIKSRLEKIEALRDYVNTNGRLPIINSNDGTERRLAIFYNNVKQLRKTGKFKDQEIVLLDEIGLRFSPSPETMASESPEIEVA